MALDRSLKALALRNAGNLDLVAGLEGVGGNGVANAQLAALVAELNKMLVSADLGGLQVAELRLAEVLLLRLTECQLDGVVAVVVAAANRRHWARTGLEHGDALNAAIIHEELGHTELLGENRGHRDT